MSDADVAFAGLRGQREVLRRGELSSRELVELTLARIERLDPELNAFGAVFPERALQDADEADRRHAAGDDTPVLGLPVGVKDMIDVAGEVTSHGSAGFTTRATADAEVVRRLREAGAIVVGKTTMSELGFWPFTETLAWGVTRNPWDPERTPGGSSGGSAAAVAAGMVPFALATDGAGSIRIPAACTGLFGLKPHEGRVPRAPHDRDGHRWIVVGPLARTVRDTAAALDAVCATDGSFGRASATPPGRLRIAVNEALPPGIVGRLAPEVRTAMRGTAELLRDLGHDVAEREIGTGIRDSAVLVALLFRGLREILDDVERPTRVERRTRTIARPGRLVGDRVKSRLERAEARLADRVARLFEDHDVLLTPVLSEPAVPCGLMDGHGATVTYLWETGWVGFNLLWNSTGQPAASVPAGFSADGLPLAVQLVGRPRAEATLLSLAAQLEAARPWADRRPPVS